MRSALVAVDVRLERRVFLEELEQLGADIGTRLFELIEPRKRVARVELQVWQGGEKILPRLLEEDPFLSRQNIERLAETRIGVQLPGRGEPLAKIAFETLCVTLAHRRCAR